MSKLFFAFVFFVFASILFKWPGYLVRDDAHARLQSTLTSPERFLRKILGQEEKSEDAESVPPEETGRLSKFDPFATPDSTEASSPITNYPLPMTIENATGTSLDVTVLGKGPDFLRFQRKSDALQFDLQLSGLSEASRSQVATLSVNLNSTDFKAPSSAPATATTREKTTSPRVSLAEGLHREIKRNEERIKEHQAIMNSTKSTSAQKSMASNTMQRLQEENRQLKEKASQFDQRF